ncbi:Acg family FMN-binding oxidoreductase [Streptomyces sp. STR69]|uniref:Acg family FMN-binding oxidoreductase n=1 Tax=Streptomyces sp. STR69 TaxID=1796942 RepID=UPI0021C8C1B2|nr:nitroreductase family protein [Streptomyces sp. STR69]
MSLALAQHGRAALHLAHAASLAPSPHNTQPWFFVEEGRDHGFEIHADRGRRLVLTDPGGRETVVACGAALFNARIAVRSLGFRPAVDLLPESGNPAYLARVGFAAHAPATFDEALMAGVLAHRHTHRGPFAAERVAEELLDELRQHARAEGADLQVVDDADQLDHLADLVRTAEDVHRADRGHTAEIAGSVGPDGVPTEACLYHPDCVLLAARDYLGLVRQFAAPPQKWVSRTGTVVVLTTPYDTRADWLRAGQALQRVLLYAEAHGVRAAFHTQPLEVPAVRGEVRTSVAFGRFPQLILRLGHTTQTWFTPRRGPAETLLRSDMRVR